MKVSWGFMQSKDGLYIFLSLHKMEGAKRYPLFISGEVGGLEPPAPY